MTDLSQEFHPYEKKYSQPKKPKPLKKVSDKNKDPKTGMRKPTGELALFRELYIKRGGKCEITGEPIEFHPRNFMHVLNKNRWKEFRLDPRNIFMVIFDIHDCYDNGSKEFLLSKYPNAQKIYDRKEELKIEYAKPKPTI